jgi:branched-chain amino acid transport system permease protein
MGYALKAIHQDEHAASRVGIDTHKIKMAAYSLSACFIGIFGALDATRLSYIKPDDAFNVHTTIKMVIMSLLGGMGTVFGPAIGATFLKLIEDYLGAEFLNYYLIIVGVVIVVVIVSLPQGIAGGLASRLAALRRSRS